ncbi:MAG: lipoyl(octanoyl) transferase LipB [Methylococcales bacterium]|jgi:lipoyl(octanoyl) transferase|nr:lipoyl(octanoyl) transferase LipB [Methylococcales bacterium]MBT7410582.1 lipoyl(octanoyl) transferase LipB [Methylococcales bacterium]
MSAVVKIKNLGLADYTSVWKSMKAFTRQRMSGDNDELWVVQHPAVYTLGLSGKKEHLLKKTAIPVVETDRGGQVTYHGPGQLIIYTLIDLKRLNMGIRSFVELIENSVIQLLKNHGVVAVSKRDAPGVYVQGNKIASLGLKVRKGCCYHGLSLNVAMDLSPFDDINVCGYSALKVTQMSLLGVDDSMDKITSDLLLILCHAMGSGLE